MPRRKKRGTPGSGGRKNGTPSSQTKSPYSSDRKQPGSAGGSTGKRPAGSRSRREDARDDAEVGAAAGDGGAASGASTPRASIDQSSISQRESVEALERKLDLASAPKAAAATRAGASGTTSGTVSAAIQGTARQLDRAIKRDAVGHLLASRADPEQLKKQGILPEETGKVAPAIAARRRSLTKEMTKNSLEHALADRPAVDDLKSKGVFKDEVQAIGDRLMHERAGDEVSKHLRHRPKPDELRERNILHSAPGDIVAAKEDALKTELTRNTLSRHFRRRLSVEELQERHILLPRDDSDSEEGEFVTESEGRAKRTESFRLQGKAGAGASEAAAAQQGAASKSWTNSASVQEQQKERRRYTLLLQAVARLYSLGHIDRDRRAFLKELILAGDESVMATLEAFEFDSDADEMLDTLLRIAARS